MLIIWLSYGIFDLQLRWIWQSHTKLFESSEFGLSAPTPGRQGSKAGEGFKELLVAWWWKWPHVMGCWWLLVAESTRWMIESKLAETVVLKPARNRNWPKTGAISVMDTFLVLQDENSVRLTPWFWHCRTLNWEQNNTVTDFWVSESYSVLYDCSPWSFQARILEGITFPFSRGSSQPTDQIQVSCIAGGFFTSWVSRGSPRILEWVAYPFSSGYSQPRNLTRVSCIAVRFFTNWAIRKASSELELWENKWIFLRH